jgi:hypothetical protein
VKKGPPSAGAIAKAAAARRFQERQQMTNAQRDHECSQRLDEFSIPAFLTTLKRFLAEARDFVEAEINDAASGRGYSEQFKSWVEEAHALCVRTIEYEQMGNAAPISALVTLVGTAQDVVDEWQRLRETAMRQSPLWTAPQSKPIGKSGRRDSRGSSSCRKVEKTIGGRTNHESAKRTGEKRRKERKCE